MHRRIVHALYATAAAAVLLSLAGFSWDGVARAGSPADGTTWTGYQASGRLFRFATTTLTVPASALPRASGGHAYLGLSTAASGAPAAFIQVAPGGGAGSVTWAAGAGHAGTFRLNPAVGDRLSLSIYYDRHGRDRFAVSDLTQAITRRSGATVGNVTYTRASLAVAISATVIPPPADVQLWQFKNCHLTTYAGKHGTMRGPWATDALVGSSSGTASGRIVASPSPLWNRGQNFGVRLHALPVTYSSAFAGYGVSGSRFRFAATTLTVPHRPAAAGNASFAYVELSHGGGPTPRPYAYIQVQSGGGAGSVRYDSLYLGGGLGTLAVSPEPGDHLAISVYYDRHGHIRFTARDLTTGKTATATTEAELARSAPYNAAALFVGVNNGQVSTRSGDIRLWAFGNSRITTYSGQHGSTLGPWATAVQIDTTTGTGTGLTVMSPSVLTDGGRGFGIWLRHH